MTITLDRPVRSPAPAPASRRSLKLWLAVTTTCSAIAMAGFIVEGSHAEQQHQRDQVRITQLENAPHIASAPGDRDLIRGLQSDLHAAALALAPYCGVGPDGRLLGPSFDPRAPGGDANSAATACMAGSRVQLGR